MPVLDALTARTRWRLPRPAVIVVLIVAGELSVTGVGIAAVTNRPRGWSATATTDSITAQAAPRTTSALRAARGTTARPAVPGAPVLPGAPPPPPAPPTRGAAATQAGTGQSAAVDITGTAGWPDPTVAPDAVGGAGAIVKPTPTASPGTPGQPPATPTPTASDPVPALG